MVTGGARAVARCDALGAAPYSDSATGLFRGYLTPAYHAAQEAIGGWMREAGMDVRRDPAANLVGRYEGREPAAPALLIGSHLDSVRDAGRYDGPLGIMLGIETVAALNDAGRRPSFPIEVYAFGDEEGSRFPAAMLTSRAVAGTLAAEALAISDGDGVTLETALSTLPPFVPSEVEGRAPGGSFEARPPTRLGTNGFVEAGREKREVFAYLEAHIEQGPVLEAAGLAVGTVTGVAAQYRYHVRVTGTAGHAGTTAMGLRRDALAGAAEMIAAIEALASADGGDLVATVGRIEALPGAANVIAGEVRFSIDIRSGDQPRRDRAAHDILERLEAIAAARGLGVTSELVFDLPASPCDPALTDLMDEAVAEAGQKVHRLVSGAGHDAMVMAALCPTTMLFIRCAGGLSHHPEEHVDPADVEIALQVMLGFVDKLEVRG